jgi:tight adherence protein C
MIGNIGALPILVVVWAGFLICLGVLLTGRLTHNTFQQRMREALNPTEDEIDDEIVEETRDDEMSKSFIHRLLAPTLKKMGQNMKEKSNDTKGGQIRDMLEQGGHPLGMHYPEFLALKTLTFFGFLGIGILTQFVAVPPLVGFFMGPTADSTTMLIFRALWVFIGAYAGYSGPTFWLRYYVNKRLKAIRKAMADVVDLIVLAIEAGLGFDQAVGQAVEKTEGPLTEELRRVLDEVRVGRPQSDAFRAMAHRVRMQELSLLVAAIDQAMKMGVGLGHALKIQATEIREARMAYIKEQAGKLPVKMMLPLVFFIFPALFVVILGPAACQMAEMGARGELSAFGG